MNETIPLQYGSAIFPRPALSVLELERDSTVTLKTQSYRGATEKVSQQYNESPVTNKEVLKILKSSREVCSRYAMRERHRKKVELRSSNLVILHISSYETSEGQLTELACSIRKRMPADLGEAFNVETAKAAA
ncbi:uncharacterized protein ATNIH1004_011347 [Aspergillus tanneri]|uniref:Uncharacterized protein n=1 Tax=Aspergillus tanneri TaxID=1220188 RepID=A0A5M9MBV7_9EURO|nr:uncharacterized protein ATNIH1004_011347 [Aspergillus tanneri]KAA8642403.1 hypothetical protein ATNIH1004_011347 [Aspergillus tanneri]